MARIRSSSRTKQTAEIRAVDFRHLWRQLKKAGWKSRKPTRLSTDWRYVAPHADESDLMEGTNIFTGEDAVVRFAITSGLINLNESSKNDVVAVGNQDEDLNGQLARDGDSDLQRAQRCGRQSGVEDGPSGEEDRVDGISGQTRRDIDMQRESTISETISASQIDCSLALSAPTLDSFFDSNDVGDGTTVREDTDDLSQNAVGHAFDLSQSVLEASDHEAVIGAFQRLVSGAESGAVSDDDMVREEGEPPVASTAVCQTIFDDVNMLKDGEDVGAFEELNSGGSSGEDELEDDMVDPRDDVIEPREYPDEVDLSDGEVEHVDDAFVESLGGSLDIDRIDKDALRATAWGEPCSVFEADPASYPQLSDDVATPIPELRDTAESPLSTFFYFMPKTLWVHIADETNRYRKQNIGERASRMRANQVRMHRPTPPETLQQLRRRLRAEKAYDTFEILFVVGLLIAHDLCPHKRRFSNHWSMTDDGAIPAGGFGRFMARNRCTSILRDLHFVNNEMPHDRDRIWKLRPVVNVLQERFRSGWSLPAVFSFDEGVLLATSRRNTTRMFMPDKPHRYGTKMFMVCDSKTAYCHRFEVYVGARETDDSIGQTVDNKTGAAAVIRNMKTILGENSRGFRLIVIDRFYSSVALALQLLSMSIYVIGTIVTNRVGYDCQIVEKRKSRPKTIERGSFTFTRCVAVPTIVACHWWDRKPVHYLATGVAMAEDRLHRNVRQVGQITVKCPKLVSDYQRWMGGVDVHDQLRLQSYSIQTAIRFRKYYKSLFLGFLDMAVVNAFITHKEACRMKGTTPMCRGDWMNTLHKQLLQLKTDDFVIETNTTPLPASRSRVKRRRQISHEHKQFDDWVTVSGVQKRRQRACKVCTLLRGNRKKSYQTTFFCMDCSNGEAKCFLCPKARREYNGVAKTCFQIWHEDFDGGNAIPESLGKRVVLRRPGKVGRRKKTRRELLQDGDAADNEDAD